MKTEFTVAKLRIHCESRTNRRWLVAGLYAAFAALETAWFVSAGNNYFGFLLFVFFAYLTRFLGGRSEPGGLVPSWDEGDERERTRRYRSHYLAYVWFDLLCFPVVAVVFWRISPEIRAAAPSVQIHVERLAWALGTAVGILYYTLPQAILLWTEPDMERCLEGAMR